MRNTIKNLIDFIEKDYHNVLSKEKIEEITNKNYQYFSRVLKKFTGMTPYQYAIRRKLSLVVCEIKESGKSIKNSNLEPWLNENSFHSAFKKEFKITPYHYIKRGNNLLQEKIDIELLENEEVLINTLKVEHKSYEGALKYLLGLPVYKTSELGSITEYENKEDLCKELVQIYYNNSKTYNNDKIFSEVKVSNDNLKKI